MLQLNGKTLQYDRAFVTEDGRQFPANWLRLASLEEKQSIGIIEVPEAPQPVWDQRFYWGVDNPKDLGKLKDTWISHIKQTASSLLCCTDWYVIRQAESGTAAPTEVVSDRAFIRSLSNQKEAAIAACHDVPALAAYVDSPEFTRWTAVTASSTDTPIEE